MSNLTDNAAEVGKHKFELAGLGAAPYKFLGVRENIFVSGCGTVRKPGGSCDYCGTGIQFEFHIKSADGKLSKVGCNCIEKVGDKGLLQAYKSSPEYRKAQREKRQAKDRAVTEELKGLMESHAVFFKSIPHPYGFTDRATGAALSYLDQIQWLFSRCGASGRASLLRSLKRVVKNETR